eukprot:3483972-Amphidinium_carterae.1
MKSQESEALCGKQLVVSRVAKGFGMEGKASKFASDVGHHHHDRVTERPSSRSKPRSARGSGEGPAASQDEMASCVKGLGLTV